MVSNPHSSVFRPGIHIHDISLPAGRIVKGRHDLIIADPACADKLIRVKGQESGMRTTGDGLLIIGARLLFHFTHIGVVRQAVGSEQHFDSRFCQQIDIRRLSFPVYQVPNLFPHG